MMIDDECRCFVQTYPRFWPKELDCEVRYGHISVRYLGCGKYPNVVVRAFAIHKVTGERER